MGDIGIPVLPAGRRRAFCAIETAIGGRLSRGVFNDRMIFCRRLRLQHETRHVTQVELHAATAQVGLQLPIQAKSIGSLRYGGQINQATGDFALGVGLVADDRLANAVDGLLTHQLLPEKCLARFMDPPG